MFAEPLVELYASGFRDVPGKIELTIRLTRLMFPFLALVTMAAVLMAMLNALHRFFVPALSPAMFNVATILCAVIAVPLAQPLGIEPIMAIAAGTLIGGLGQILLQWPVLRREGFRYQPVLDIHDPWLREIGRLMVPGVAGLAAVQINLFVNSWLAAGLGTGAVSWLDYAFRLMYMPIGLFGISIATASLPAISGHAASRNDPGLRQRGVERAAHDADAERAGHARAARAGDADRSLDLRTGPIHARRYRGYRRGARLLRTGLMGYSAVKLMSPAFYALGNSRVPVIASAASVAFNIALSLVLVRSLGHRGLALGTAAAALLNAGVLLVDARDAARRPRRATPPDRRRENLARVHRDGAGGVLCRTGAARSVRGRRVAAQAVRVFGAIAIGMGVLAACAHLLRIEEFAQVRRRVLRY